MTGTSVNDREWKLGEDLFLDDNLLDGITFEEVVTTITCNARYITRNSVMEAIKDILDCRMEDFNYLLDNNMDEIIKEAVKRRVGD